MFWIARVSAGGHTCSEAHPPPRFPCTQAEVISAVMPGSQEESTRMDTGGIRRTYSGVAKRTEGAITSIELQYRSTQAIFFFLCDPTKKCSGSTLFYKWNDLYSNSSNFFGFTNLAEGDWRAENCFKCKFDGSPALPNGGLQYSCLQTLANLFMIVCCSYLMFLFIQRCPYLFHAALSVVLLDGTEQENL